MQNDGEETHTQTEILSTQSNETNTDTQTEAETGEPVTVTVALELDQEALQERQATLQQELQNGSINQTEAQQQLRDLQQELLSTAVTEFKESVKDDSTLTIDETATQIGIVLVTGQPTSLIKTLSFEEVRGLFPESSFEEAQQA